jgi:hypothetical protein
MLCTLLQGRGEALVNSDYGTVSDKGATQQPGNHGGKAPRASLLEHTFKQKRCDGWLSHGLEQLRWFERTHVISSRRELLQSVHRIVDSEDFDATPQGRCLRKPRSSD